MTHGRTALVADWVLPISAPPIADGALIIEGSRIVQRASGADVRSGAIAVDVVQEYHGAALMPGLVNVHTHLELTALRGFLEGLDFATWLQVLTAARSTLFDEDEIFVAATAGIREGLLAGVTTFADATATGVPMRALVASGVRGIAYLEVFGPDPAQRETSMQGLRAGLEKLHGLQTDRVRVGVSPHAPYTVSQSLFSDVARLAHEQSLPVAVHVAESPSEVEFVRDGSGHFAERLQQRGIPGASRHRSPVALLDATGLLDTKPLLIHAIHVDDTDLDTIRRTGASIAHCPVSNAKLGQGMAALARMLHAGIPTGLGSDSVASNNRMDILGEARQATLTGAVHPHAAMQLSAHDALALATIGGARALGLDSDIGTFDAGKAADVVVFDLHQASFGPVYDPAVTLVHTLAGRADVRLLMVNGETLVSDGVVQRDDPDLSGRMTVMADKLRRWSPPS